MVVVTGDGAFGINAMEIDSAKRHGAKVVFIVANNAAWNIERLDQEMNYGGRVVGTTLAWSDYAAMARAFGLHGERVTDPARLAGAIREAFEKAPALIDVVVTRDALSSDAGKGLGWVPDYQALTAWDDAERARARMASIPSSAKARPPANARKCTRAAVLTCRRRSSPRMRGCSPTRSARATRSAP